MSGTIKMKLRQRKKPVSCLPHINNKIEELPEANLFQRANTNCSSVRITDHAEKPIETTSFEVVDNISDKEKNKRNKRELEEDKRANTNFIFVQITDHAEKSIETASFDVVDNISDKERNKRNKRKLEEDKPKDTNCSWVDIHPFNGKAKRRTRDEIDGDMSSCLRTKRRNIKKLDQLRTTTELKRKGNCEKCKNKTVEELALQPSTSSVCYKKQTLEEGKDCLNCIAPIRSDEVTANGSEEDNTLDNFDLNELLREDGKTSHKLKEECRKICNVIKDSSKDIVHVEAAYRKEDKEKVIFLAFAEAEIIIKSNWVTELRIVNKYSEESRFVLYCKENNRLPEKDSVEIGEIIDKYSKNLMSKHKFLSAISASTVVSKHFGTNKHIMIKQPCIVLTVLVKGIIPLFEEPFPTDLDGIVVDVREGGIRLCQQNVNAYQTNVSIGCQISSSSNPFGFGSLGGFIEHPEHGLCGITCAHVVFNDFLKSKLRESSTVTVTENPLGVIYQPVCRVDNEIGRLVEIVYKKGNKDTPGVDIAVFKIEKRAPINGGFPDSQLTSFNAGLVWTKTGIPSDHIEVQKYGCASGNTTGVIQFNNCVVREIDFDGVMELKDKSRLETSLFKQYHIKPSTKQIMFCDEGDSGSLVFMKDNTGGDVDLRCIGMVVGRWSDGCCAVTPITPILDELKVKQLKPFIPNILKQISDKLDTVHDTFDRRFGELDGLIRGRQWCNIM